MRNRKNIIRKIALGIVAAVLLTMTLSFVVSNRTGADKPEAVETFYGKAMFGGNFAWLDNVKRPGLSAAFTNASALPFDFSTSNAVSDNLVTPTQDLTLIASVSFLPNDLNYRGPFDGEQAPGDIFSLDQLQLVYPTDDDDDHHHYYSSNTIPDDKGGDDDDGDNGSDDDHDTPVVPLPGSISLALIGLAALSKFRSKLL